MKRIARDFKGVLRSAFERLNDYNPNYLQTTQIERLERIVPTEVRTPNWNHLQSAIEWIKQAQDIGGAEGGVSWGFRARRPFRANYPLGWMPSYPETTGYIISTMLRYADLTSDEDSRKRARRMADWELRIQLPDGGFQGGFIGATPVTSSTFVTGQVLFGLIDAYETFGDSKYVEAALRGGDFLLGCLDDAGRFVRGHSAFCVPGSKAYEIRIAYALALLGRTVQDGRYQEAASQMANYTLVCQSANGWFRENDLNDHQRPLTHTIGYVLEGLEGIGTLLGRADCLEAAAVTLEQLQKCVREDGFLAGRWTSEWQPAVPWACLTGNAQIAGAYLREYGRNLHPEYLDCGSRLLGFVAWTQDLKCKSAELAGGIRGSYPFRGEYCQWSVPNWASKFFADSMMDYLLLFPQGR